MKQISLLILSVVSILPIGAHAADTAGVDRLSYATLQEHCTVKISNPATSTSYYTYEYAGSSGAAYLVNMQHRKDGLDYMRFRSSTNGSGIVTTQSGGYVSCITVQWDGMTEDGRALLIYGSDSPFGTTDDIKTLPEANLLATLDYDLATKPQLISTYTFEQPCRYIAICSAEGALVLAQVDVEWVSTWDAAQPGIEAEPITPADTPRYDLTGRQVSSEHRGITITSGRKELRW